MDILPTRGRRRRADAPDAGPLPTGPPPTTPPPAKAPAPAQPLAVSSPAASSVAASATAPSPALPELGRRARRQAQPRSRAGRNLPAATGVGLALGGMVAASLFVRKEAFVVVVAIAVVLSVWELTSAFATRGLKVPVVPVLVGSLGMVVSAYAAGEEALLVAFSLTALGLLLWRVIDGPDGAVRDVAAGVFTAAYVPFLAGFTMLMLAADDGATRIVVFVLVTIASDIGGYAVGVVAGRHPLAPSVSPKKSWEGLAGSVAFCLATGVLAVVLLLDGAWWAGALVGLAAVATATVGDLSESLLKRDLGIKDMGAVLPGHGGMMDRIDSLLPTAPVVYLLLAVLVPVAT